MNRYTRLTNETRKILIEKLAEQVHVQWSGWMEYLFKQGTFNTRGLWYMNMDALNHWTRQKDTPYAKLTESEKMSDINEAEKFLSIMEKTKDNEKK